MLRIRSAAATALLVVISSLSIAHAEETAVLVDDLTGIRSDVIITEDELQVAAEEGVIYRYLRDAEHDGPQSYCYYNETLDQALRWPLDPQDPLQILKPGAARYQRSAMRIVDRRGAIGDGGSTLPSAEGLSAFLIDEPDGGGEPRGQLQLAHVHPIDDGVVNAEFFSWEHEEFQYEVARQIVEEVIVGGRTRQVERTVTETRTAIRPRFALSTLTLSVEQMTAFLPNGTQLNNDTLQLALGIGAPAVMVSDLAQGDASDLKLDARLLRLLQPTTPIIVYDSAATPSPRRDLAPDEAGDDYPMTPIAFRGAIIDAGGELQLSEGGYQQEVRTYTVRVPVTESRIVNGKEVQVTSFIEEQRTHSVAVWISNVVPFAPGAYELYVLGGRKLPSANAARILQTPRTVVFVDHGQELDPWYRKVLRSRTLLVATTAPGVPAPSPFVDPNQPRSPRSDPRVHNGIETEIDQLFAKFARRGARSLVGEYSRLNPRNDWHRGAISLDGTTPDGGVLLRWTNHAGASWGLTPDLPNCVLKCGPDNPFHDRPEAQTFQIVLGQNADGDPVVAGFHFKHQAGFIRQDSRDAAAQLTADAGALKQPDGNHADAVVMYQEAIRLNPLFIAAHHELGIALREMGRPAEALGPLSSALELDDEDAMIWYNRAFANLDLGESQAALRDIREAINLRQDDAGFHYLRASILEGMGETNQANAARSLAKRLEAAQP